jgi:hypothetical protein
VVYWCTVRDACASWTLRSGPIIFLLAKAASVAQIKRSDYTPVVDDIPVYCFIGGPLANVSFDTDPPREGRSWVAREVSPVASITSCWCAVLSHSRPAEVLPCF